MKQTNIYTKEEILNACRYYGKLPSIPMDVEDLSDDMHEFDEYDDEVLFFWICEEAAVNSADQEEALRAWRLIGEPGKTYNILPIIIAYQFMHYSKGADAHLNECIESFEKEYLPLYIASTSI